MGDDIQELLRVLAKAELYITAYLTGFAPPGGRATAQKLRAEIQAILAHALPINPLEETIAARKAEAEEAEAHKLRQFMGDALQGDVHE